MMIVVAVDRFYIAIMVVLRVQCWLQVTSITALVVILNTFGNATVSFSI